MLGICERGAVDITEEIPSILVIIVATFLFLMMMTEGVMTYTRFQDERGLADDVESFCDSVLSYGPLLYESVHGQIDSTKLTARTAEKLRESFNPGTVGFHYNITLLDVGLYENRHSWFAGEAIEDEGAVWEASVPATVRAELGQIHPVILKVIVWR